MTNVSNMYAAKLYSEHPIGIWPIDDDFPYISLITNQQRRFEADSPYLGWNITNGTANDSLELPNIGSPFSSDIYAGIEGDVPLSDGTYIEAKSPDTFLFSDCSEELKTFCISAYVYQDSIYVSEYEIGYEYYDDSTSSWIEVYTIIPATDRREWVHIQDTFLVEQFDADYCHIIFRAKVNTGGSSGDYNFIFNGITVGQWSEPFTSNSLGANTEDAPLSSGLSNKVVSSDQYGVLSQNAYFVCENGKALAANRGIPMIFGSENVTKIYASSDGSPSFIFPNKGFFTTDGISKDFTLEFWLKTRPSTKESRRIVGPIDTNDGIYVSEGFITLVVDGKFSSHNVSYWYRPMLVHIYIKGDTFYMLINGEQVAQITVNKNTISLSESEWLGFYSYDDINLMEIDCISIFPYAIPLQVSRKRFVWGQGTDPLELINDSFDGEEAIINFANANYTVNKVYPDMERWDAGYYNNLVANTNSISVPQYSLPTVYLGGRDIVEWYSDCKDLNDLLYPSGNHPKNISFRPNIEDGEWGPTTGTNWTEPCYLNFPSLTFLSNPLSSIYGIFEVESEVEETRPLIHIVNTLTGKRFEINITGYDITYEFDGQELSGTGFTVSNSHFVVGFHIPTLTQSFNYELSSFFGSPEVLSMFVGGDGTSTFEGKIYRIGFSDQANYASISEHFKENGIVDNADEALLEGHYASYTLSPFFRYNAFFLDISVSSQWEEYFPLSSFASYIRTNDGGTSYDLDYLQFNFGYPSLINIVETSVDNPDWTYQELFEAYNDPIQKNYSILDNSLLSGYLDYSDLAANIITEYQIDTSQSSLDAYVTFQLLAEGADEPLSSFAYTKNLTDSYTVYADNQNTNADPYKAYRTKFRIIDGTIIYPPKTINFKNVAMVVHFEIEQDGIISNPLKVKNLEITSKSLNQNSLTAIGTKTGTPIYPYVKTGIYYSGKSKNPVMIGKQNLPYLYLTENTGIKILDTDAEIEYGSLIPINKNKSANYLLGAFQLFMKYDIFQTISTTQSIFYLTHKDGDIEFTITPGQSIERFYISARNKSTKEEYSGISFYQNGIKVKNPYIEKYDWNVIAFSFDEPLDMNNFSGSLNLLFGCTYSNISFFKSTGLNEFGVTIARTWEDVLYNDQEIDPGNIVDWQYWYDQNGILDIPNKWKEVYVLEEARKFSTTPKEIYSTYTGTNIIVIDDNTGMSVINDQFSVFSSTVWTDPSYILKPV
jgi:hypothetical protein